MNNGGSAFPCTYTTGSVEKGFITTVIPGMSLRDYFAGQVVTRGSRIFETAGDLAEWAYRIADALIAEREKEKK